MSSSNTDQRARTVRKFCGCVPRTLNVLVHRMGLCRTKLCGEIRHLARRMEVERFPMLRRGGDSECVIVPVEAGDGLDLRAGGRTLPFSMPSGVLAGFLQGVGIRAITFDTDLESNQINDVFDILWILRRRLRGGEPGYWSRVFGHDAMFAALGSEDGLHIACCQVNLDRETGRMCIRNSYCPLTLSRAATAFMNRTSRFRDHRSFFLAAPRYALIVAVLVLAPTLQMARHSSHPVAAVIVVLLLALLLGTGTFVVLQAIGAIQYDKEHQAKELAKRHEGLVRAHESLGKDLERARRIQERLIPDEAADPMPGHAAVASWFRPEMAVGGDYYDFRRLPDDRLAILLADVSGHGMSGAFVTGIIKTAFELGYRADMSPAAFMALLNGELERLTPDDSFAAIIFAVYDAPQNTLSYATAGHAPVPMILRRSAEQVFLSEPMGLVAGVTAGATYEDGTVALNPGDKFVLCTDGITDTVSPEGVLYGLPRLRGLLHCAVEMSADELCRLIQSAVLTHAANGEQNDDQTLVIVEALGV
jgi:serine phosphatase RsbU (regulator of sigma subunit)